MEAAALEYAMLLQQQQHQQLQQDPSRPCQQQQPSVIYRRSVDNLTEPYDTKQPQHAHANAQQAQHQGQHFMHCAAPPPAQQPPSSSAQTSPVVVAPMPDPQKPTFFSANGAHAPISCDIKPRLTKEQHDILESHFQKQNKPNTSTKKGFADTLNVSLDKVNNWFQNRRAKSKQDAKKLANTQAPVVNHDQPPELQSSQQNSLLHDVDALQLEQQQAHQHGQVDGLMHDDGGVQPITFSDAEYYNMMQNCVTGDATLTNQGENSVRAANSFAHQMDLYPSLGLNNGLDMTQVGDYPMLGRAPQQQHGMFDSPQEMNRRTLTQEHFDALEQQNAMPPSDFRQELYSLTTHMSAPQSSNDSTIPSSVSDGSAYPSSEWVDSRSSSISLLPEDNYTNVSGSHSDVTSSSANGLWPSAHSSLVDLNPIDQEIPQMQQVQQLTQPMSHQDQRLMMWPSEHNSVREAQALLLAQQMSHVELQTPRPQQNAHFKSPPPPSSIAARRQRPRPAALGIASLRSQSYTGAGQAASPGASTQTAPAPPQVQTLRRIRSSNVVTGLAQGRVQKGLPSAAQRSPLAWNFSESLISPKALRHQSSGTLAPPTPMSPKEFAWQPPPQANRPGSHWQNAGRQPSISETDAEYLVSSTPITALLDQNASSPPHTPMFQPNPFLQHLGNGTTIENTPPQSAPATQTSFFNTFSSNPTAMPAQAQVPTQNTRRNTQTFSEMQQQFMNAAVSEHPSMHDATFYGQQNPPSIITEAVSLLQMQYVSNMIRNQSQSTVPCQSALHLFNPPNSTQNHPSTQTFPPFPELHGFESQQAQLHLSSSSPVLQPEIPSSGPADFFVHQYNPPADTSVRVHDTKKYSDTGPKSYTFANQGPEHFEKGKKSIDAKEMETGSTSASTISSESAHDYQSA